MDRIYFTINEDIAKRAHEMMSFSDYRENSKTSEYRALCNETYDLAEHAIEERPDSADKIKGLAVSYAKRMAENFNKEFNIGTRCPSIMIAGGSNFPTGKKEKQVAAWDKNMEEYNEIQKIKERIKSIVSGKDIIHSNDEGAIEKLEKKLEQLKSQQGRMKAANRAIRLKNVEKGNERLKEMGFSENDISVLREPDFCGRVGYPSYMLSNNNANIHRIEGRIKELKATKERGCSETELSFCKVVENTELMRIQLLFNGKPEKEVRDLLKHNGFKWSPKNGAWQRNLNKNGRFVLKCMIPQLIKMYGAE